MAHEPARVGLPGIGSGFVARPELSSRLDRRARLTVVRGPARAGKSSLVADWLAGPGARETVLWVTRADGVGSRSDYWASVLDELDRFASPVAADEGVGSSADGDGAATVDVRERVLAAFAGLRGPLLLVLDDVGPPGAYWEEVGQDLLAALAATPDLSAIVIGREPLRLEAPGGTVVISLPRARLASDPARTRAQPRRAADAPRARGRQHATARERFAMAAGEAIAERALGRPAESADAARDALAAAREMSHGERSALGTDYPMLLGQAGLCAFAALEPALAHACFHAELAASPRVTLGRRRNVSLSHLALLAALGGRMRRAERLLAEIVEADWALEQRGATPSAPYAVAAAYVAINRGEPGAGAELLDAYGGDRVPAGENWALSAVAHAVCDALGGRAREARAALAAAREARRGRGERAGAEAAGLQTALELLELVSPEPVVVSTRDGAVSGRSAVHLLTVRAVRAALGGRTQTAEELLGRATRFGTSPLQDLAATIARVVIARRTRDELAAPAARIAGIVVEHGLNWPLAFLGDADRAALLDALRAADPTDPPGGAETLRIAFSRIPASAALAPELAELHPRELAVLRGLAATGSRAQLAARSGVSVNTIKTQLRSLYRKLGAGDRAAALARAAELGLISR